MLYLLKNLESFWGPFRLFEYISVRAILAGFTALALGLLLSGPIIRALSRLRQPERSRALMGELAKEGGKVPTMGGLLIGAAMVPSVLLWARPNVLVLASLWSLVGMGLVGLVISIIQAATSVNEQTVSFVPKLLALLFVLAVFGAAMGGLLIDYTRDLLIHIPDDIQ